MIRCGQRSCVSWWRRAGGEPWIRGWKGCRDFVLALPNKYETPTPMLRGRLLCQKLRSSVEDMRHVDGMQCESYHSACLLVRVAIVIAIS